MWELTVLWEQHMQAYKKKLARIWWSCAEAKAGRLSVSQIKYVAKAAKRTAIQRYRNHTQCLPNKTGAAVTIFKNNFQFCCHLY